MAIISRNLLFTLILISIFLVVIIAFLFSTKTESNNTQLANPASTYCIEQGHELEIREDEQGNQYGVCISSEGKECEEWQYYRGECLLE